MLIRILLSVCFVNLFLLYPIVFASPAGKGKELYKLCASCHGSEGHGNVKLQAPAIAGLPAWYTLSQLKKFRDGQRGKHPDDIAGMRMRPMARTLREGADLESVARYTEKLSSRRGAVSLQGNPENGKARYAVCVACHGVNGEGNKALNAPPLKNSNDWYLLRQLKNFKAGVRGNPQIDPTGAVMTPMAQILEDENVMKDIITYIQTL